MALFPNDPDGAISATLAFERFLVEFNNQLAGRGKSPIQIGTGLHTGKLILGTIGHDHRLETTVISDSVNTASRVEGLTKYYQAKAIITESTLKLVKQKDFYYRFLDNVMVKGKSTSISIYELIDDNNMLKISTLDDYNKGLDYIKQREIAKGAEQFRKLLKINPEDKAVEILLEKCEYFLNDSSSNSVWSDETQMLNK